jgi:hypothetical protein
MKRARFNAHWAGYFEDEVYRVRVEVLWPVTVTEVKAYINKAYPEIDYQDTGDFGAKCVRFTLKTGLHVNIICMAQWPRKPDAYDYSFLAHECFHAASHILQRTGMPLENFVSSEAYAFLLESIMRRSLLILDTSRKLK